MNYTINGKLVDENTGEGVPFANIYLISNASKGTTTGYDGNFTFEVPNVDSMVGISHIQYRNIQLSAGDLNYRTTELEPEAVQVDEVVIKPKKYGALIGGISLAVIIALIVKTKMA